jgi:lysophospholipase L1-like esterase
MHHPPSARNNNPNRKVFSPIRPVNHARYIPVAPTKEAPTMMKSLLPSFKCMPTSAGKGFQAPRILCYGDSLTAGLAGNFVKTYAPYAARLSDLLSCQVDHVGLCGLTAAEMARMLDKPTAVDVKRNKWTNAGLRYALRKAQDEGNPYTAVVIMAGTNDLNTSSAREIVANLLTLHEEVRRAGAVSVACAVPKHGAIICEEYSSHLDPGQRKSMNAKVDELNALLRAHVARVNESAEDSGWIAFVDVHSEVLKKAGSDKANTYAGYPTLGEFNEFYGLETASGKGKPSEKIQKTQAGSELKAKNASLYNMLEDALHFSPAGYRSFAETLCEMCKSHLVRLN